MMKKRFCLFWYTVKRIFCEIYGMDIDFSVSGIIYFEEEQRGMQ